MTYPEELDIDGTADETDTESERGEITVTCVNCEERYTPDDARTIAIFGPGDVRYTCPQCGHGTADFRLGGYPTNPG